MTPELDERFDADVPLRETIVGVCAACTYPSAEHYLCVREPAFWVCPNGKEAPRLVAAGIAPLLARTVIRTHKAEANE